MKAWLGALLASTCAIGCTPVDGDRILGADLARADARFAAIPGDYNAGFAPLPGVQRFFEVRDLVRIGRQYGINVEGIRGLCFERRTAVLTEERLRAVLDPLIPPEAVLEIADFSRSPLPVGELTFALADLGRPAANDPRAPVLWRGRLVYGSGRSAITWAKVRLTVKETWLEAARAIPAGRPIAPDDLVQREEQRFPFATAPVRDLEAAVGKTVTRTLSKGQVLAPALLAAAPDVRRGDAVNVRVSSGRVRLQFWGRALNSGKVDDQILIEMGSGKKLKAQIREKGEVLIDADRK